MIFYSGFFLIAFFLKYKNEELSPRYYKHSNICGSVNYLNLPNIVIFNDNETAYLLFRDNINIVFFFRYHLKMLQMKVVGILSFIMKDTLLAML